MTTLPHVHEMIARGDLTDAAAELAALHGKADPFDYEVACADIYMREHRFIDALDRWNNARAMQPWSAQAWYGLGICFQHMGQFDESAAAHRMVLKIAPSHAKAWMKLAFANLVTGHYPESLASYERAINLDPADAELYGGYGTVLHIYGDDRAAIAQYRKALELNPDYHEAETGLGFTLLRAGEWEEGWKRFEARWKRAPFGAPWNYQIPPVWSGPAEELRGKRVLLRCEQGHGDTIQFCRYVPMVANIAEKVWLVGAPSMARLLQGMGARFIPEGDPWPEHDVLVGLMTLPGTFGTTATKAPGPAWFDVPARAQKARVGVCWHGGARREEPLAHADDVRRSIPWEMFAPITEVVPCVSLQEEDLDVADWRDTAEIVKGLDLVITVDTAIAHLAGSLRVPCWTLLRTGGCWRWLSRGDTTVWYPGMKLYRQEILDEWRPVIMRVTEDLKVWADAQEKVRL